MVSPTTWNPQFISSQWMHPSSSDMVKRIPCAPQNPGGALAMLPTLGVSSTWAKCQHCVWVSFRFIIIHLPHLSSPLSFLTSFQTPWYAFIHSFHTLLVFELSVAQLRRLAPISKEGKIWAQGSVKVITETKIRLRHRHIGCLISTKDLKVNCQRQRSDRVSNTDMKSDGFVTLFGDIFGEGFGQLQHLCVLACVERG